MKVERAERLLEDEVGEGAQLGEERRLDAEAHQSMKLPHIIKRRVAHKNHRAAAPRVGFKDARVDRLKRRLAHSPKRREELGERRARDRIVLFAHTNSAFFSSSSASTSIHVS